MKISRGVRGHAPPIKFLENLDCLRLHFARFHRRESEKDNHRLVTTRSKLPPALDLLKMQHRAQNNSWLVTYPMAGQIKFSSYIPRFCLVKYMINVKFSNAVNYLYISELVKTGNHV